MRHLAILCALLLALVLPQAGLAQSEDEDRGYLQGLLEDNLSGAGRDVRIVGFAGALSSVATIEELTIADDAGVWITVRGIELDWSRAALLRGRVEVNRFSAEEIILPRLPSAATTTEDLPEPEATPFSLPELPVSIRLGELAIDRVELGEAVMGVAAELSVTGSAELAGGEGTATLNVERLDAASDELSLTGSFSNETRNLSLDLTLDESPGGIAATLLGLPNSPAMVVTIQGDGPLDDFAADITVATDGTDRLTGNVTLAALPQGEGPGTGFSADLDGDIRPLLQPEHRAFFGPELVLDVVGRQLDDGRLRLDTLELSAEALTLSGQLALGPDKWPEAFDLTGRIAGPDGTPVLLALPGADTRVQGVDLDVQYDAATGDSWTARIAVDDLQRADISMDQARIDGSGTLTRGTGSTVGAAEGRFDITATDLVPTDAGLAEALGREITGLITFNWTEGRPLNLPQVQLSGDSFRLDGTMSVGGLEDDPSPDIIADLQITADDISRFSGLAGRELGGDVDLRIIGSVIPLDGAFDGTVSGTATDIVTGVAELDPLLDGTSTLSIDADRGADGIQLREFDLQAPGASITANGTLASAGSQARFDVTIPDTSLVRPELQGQTQVTGTARQTGDSWAFDARATAPGGVVFDGTASLALVEGVLGQISGNGTLNADDLSLYSELARRDLGGSLNLRGTGRYDPADQSFDADVTGTTTNLRADIPQVDNLLQGRTTLTLDATRDATGITLRTLDLSGTRVSIEADGILRDANSRARFDVSLVDTADVLPSLSGPLDLEGTITQAADEWEIDAEGTGPGELALDALARVTYTYTDLNSIAAGTLGPIRGEGTVSAGSLAPYSDIAGRDLGGAISLQGSGRFDPADQSFAADVTGTSTDLRADVPQVDGLMQGDATFALDATRDATGITLRTLNLTAPRISLAAGGALLDDNSRARFDLTLQDAGDALPSLSGPVSLEGTASQSGDQWTIDAEGTGPGRLMLDAMANVTYSYDDLNSIAQGTLGPVSGEGTVSADTLAPYAELAGRDLGGAFSVTGNGSYDPDTMYFEADVTGSTRDLKTGIAQADNLLEGQTTFAVDAGQDADGLLVRNLRIDGPRITATGEGILRDQSSAARFDVVLENLADVLPQMSGAGGARVSGSVDQTGDDFAFDVTGSGPGGLSLDGSGQFAYADGALGPISGQGTVRASNLGAFSGVAGRQLGGAFDLTGSGSFNPDNATFDAKLDGTATNLRSGIAQVDQLAVGTTTLAVDARRTPDQTIVIEVFELSNPQVVASASGRLNPQGAGNLNYDLRLNNLGLFAPGFDGPATARGTASSAGGDYRIDADLTGPGGTRATVAGTVAPDASRANLAINGNAPLALANTFTAPRILSGTAGFNLRLNGPPALESLSGTISSTDGQVILPNLRFDLLNIRADVGLSGGRAQLDVLTDVSTGGSVRVTGPVTLEPPFNGDLAIELREVQYSDPGLVETELEGQLAMQGALAQNARITGTINVLNTEVRIPDTGLGSTGIDFELRHVNEPVDVRRTRERAGLIASESASSGPQVSYPLDVLINAPARIFVRGRGLDAELGGQLRLRGTTTNMIPQGRFDLIRGRLDILGQRLDLTQAAIQLEGSFVPVIDVRAETERADTNIFILIQGPVSDPEVDITSSPDRPEEEVLALLLFGRDVTEISAFQAVRIASAVNTLVGRGGTGIVDRLRMGFGLDDFDVQTAADGTTELRFGKYIGENLYTDVTVDSGGSTEINLNLDVTPNITARGSVGSDGNTSLGVFFEKDY
ncbi:translocation/assembly module TamB domain-containing protein [Thalassococcus sp. BH17M4-6]|uniref:translocation/assembly module TamB domain-containing protein n=1 Tax=Thalassococcus sp. BH17M4-6 TaxID=3413148 RepID=UPI003BD6977C